jgi:hypothetical protein
LTDGVQPREDAGPVSLLAVDDDQHIREYTGDLPGRSHGLPDERIRRKHSGRGTGVHGIIPGGYSGPAVFNLEFVPSRVILIFELPR